MRNYIDSFLAYMKIERIACPSTIYDYNKELIRFFDFIISKNILDINLISTRIIRQYFYYAKEKRGLGSGTISKIIAIVKSFFNYLEEEDITVKNPTRKIRVPKKINKIPSVMSKYEVDSVIRSVDFAPLRCRKNNVRDRLILSLLYPGSV
ncbi:unnamed protein product [marine sediment metagenome]|uniref:Core-binding (CB) domain-containing protein n=1 Tax=marine sediment metagenome TaxID=412755 RepID=X1M128_9ZZZZ